MKEIAQINPIENNAHPSKAELFDLEKMAEDGMITDSIYNTIKENPFCIEMIKEIAEFDEITFKHSFGVARYVELISKKIGLDKRTAEDLILAALLHDLGKSDEDISKVVKKNGPLDSREKEIMRRHPEIAFRRLEGRANDVVRKIVVAHHEDNYRTGSVKSQPENLELPLRIFFISDDFDALISERQYKEGLPIDEVEEILRKKFKRDDDQRFIDILVDDFKNKIQ